MAASLDIVNGWQSSRKDRISPEKRRRDVEDVDYDTDFEFCVNGWNSVIGETPISVANELSVDGENLPLLHCPVEPQPVPIARHVVLESLRRLSPFRSTCSPFSKIINWCRGNVSSKSLRHKYNKIQHEPGSEAEEGKAETKAKQCTAGRGKLGSPGLPASRMGGVLSDQRRVGGNRRLMVRNSERSSSTAAKAAGLDSPPPGKTMAKGSSFVKANNYMGGGGVNVSPVVNVTDCIGCAGGRWNGGGGGLFGFLSKREKRQPQRIASRAFIDRKKGT